MRLSRRPTRWLSTWLTAMLLFAQVAAAAYACPTTAAVSAALEAPMAMAEMPGCSGNLHGAADPDLPQLCQAHCQPGAQTIHPTPASDAPTTAVLLAVLDWTPTARLPAQAAGLVDEISPGTSPPGSPPLYLSLLVLRN